MKRLTILLLLLTLLCGCSKLVTNEYSVVREHSDAELAEPADALRAESYDELKNAMLSFVKSGVTHGVIHVFNYSGDVPSDAPAAAYDIWKNDPIGAYAVDYIATDCNLLVSYYEIQVDITFRHTRSEIAAIEYVRGVSGAQQAIEDALDRTFPSLTLRVSAYDKTMDCAEIVSTYCEANPETVMETPEIEVSLYPDSGSTRIVELTFTYQHTAEKLEAMRSAVGGVLSSAVNYVSYREEPDAKAELLYSFLSDRFDYKQEETSTPVYSLLCEGIADSKTFSQIFQILCDRVGIECQTVAGYLDGESYYWNILCLNGQCRHVDLLHSAAEHAQQLRYYTDDEMTRYSWDREAYPACVYAQPAAPETPVETAEPEAGEEPAEAEVPPEEPEIPEEAPESENPA